MDDQTYDDADVFSYAIRINDVNSAEFSFAGMTDFDRTTFAIGNEVQILRDGNLEFLGDVVGQSNFIAGQTKIRIQGREVKGLGKQVIDVSTMTDDGVYTGTQSSTIYSEIVSQSTIFTLGTVESSVATDFKVNKSNSLYNSLKRLAIQLGQEIEVDYDNLEINIRDSLGTSDSFDFKENVDVTSVKFDLNEPQAKKVIVYGDGAGSTQIKGEATSGGFVAGDRVEVITDLNIKTTTQANERASAELAVFEQDVKVYDFNINEFDLDINLGDDGTLDAPSSGADDNSVRVIELRRGRSGDSEQLACVVSNLEFNRLLKNRAGQVSALNRDIKEAETADAAGLNITSSGVANAYNVNSNTPLVVGFTVSTDEYKSDGGMPVFDTFSFDYDLDPYKPGAGDIDLTNDSDVDGASGDTEPAVSGLSGTENPNVSGSTSAEDAGGSGWSSGSVASDSFSGPLTGGVNQTDVLSTANIDASLYSMFVVELTITYNSGNMSVDDIASWKIKIGGSTQIIDFRSEFGAIFEGENLIMNYLLRSNNAPGTDFKLDWRANENVDVTMSMQVYGFSKEHSHSDGSLSADNHEHSDGSYIADDHGHTDGSFAVDSTDFNNKITFGDEVNQAGSVNGTSVDIFLDYWNGSAWVTKNSVLNTNKTIDEGVDLSAGGTFPDAFGQWRVRMFTNSVDGDYGNGITRLKHEIE